MVNKRDASLDAARGGALFLVVISHAFSVPAYFTSFYIIAFFFLSGYLYKPGKNYGENLKKKAKRILVPYFVNSWILLACYVLLKGSSDVSWWSIVEGILYSRNYIHVSGMSIPIMGEIWNGPMWFLTAFFSTSLVFHLLVDKVVNDTKRLMMLFCLGILCSMALNTLPILLPWSLDMVPFFTIVMVVGCYVKNNTTQLDWGWAAIITTTVIYIGIVYESGAENLSVRNYGGGVVNSMLSGLTGTFLCLGLCKKKCIRFFVKIGTNSIVVLSYHLVILGALRTVSSLYLPTMTGGGRILCEIAIVFTTFLICLLIGWLYEKVKNQVENCLAKTL